VNPWTGPGPAKILRELSNTSCEVVLNGKTLSMNYNRVVKFTPWDEAHSLTCTDIWSEEQKERSDEPPRKKVKYDDVASGDVILFGLNDGTSAKNAYAVAQVLNVNKEGWIHFQWMGNYSNTKERKFLLGWVDPKDNKEYYLKKHLHPSHLKFTGVDTETYIDTSRVLLKGPALIKESGKLTPYALDLVSKMENNA
jgi:hypothetical protein